MNKLERKTNTVIRAAIAAAFAMALALCLPSAAFALEGETAGTDGQASPTGTIANEPAVSTPDNGTATNGGEAASASETGGQTLAAAGSSDNDLVAAAVASADDWDVSPIDENTVALTRYKGADKTEIVVPNKIDGRSVVVKKSAFAGNTELQGALEKITFQDGVKLDGDASNMFEAYKALTTVVANGLDTSGCANMNVMFHNCENLATLDTSEWDVSSVTSMNDLFNGCKALTALDVSKWDVSSVTSMTNTFHDCKMITELDVSKWDTSNVTDMNNMFNNCRALTTLDVSRWNVGNVTNMRNTFASCRSLTALDVSKWDVRNVTTFESAFDGMPATTVLDLRNWEAASVNAEAVLSEGKWEAGGWLRAFRGPMLLVNDGQMKMRVASPNQEGKYLGFDVRGHYGVFLDDSMERVYCLNMGIPTPAGNWFTKSSEPLTPEGLQRLAGLIADTKLDNETRWKKIAAAITFFGNVIDNDAQNTLQDVIWYYSDGHHNPVTREDVPLPDSAKEMLAFVEANWQTIDYSKTIINFYDSGTNPTVPDPVYGYSNKYQNMISLATAKSTLHKNAASIKISKKIATESCKDTDQEFTFTVKLKNPDGTPYTDSYVMYIHSTAQGEETEIVAPSMEGVITMVIEGEGEASLANLRPGATFSITEASIDGWIQVGVANAEGTTTASTMSLVTFTNDRKDAETSATVRKVWDDGNNLDKLRSASITVTLSNGTTVELSEENSWTATIMGLPKYDANGKLIAYTWTEGNMPEGYVLASTTVDGTVTTLTNAHKREEKGGTEETKGAKGAGAAGGMAQTGDALAAWLFAMLAAASLAVLVVAGRKQHSR